MTLDDLPAWAGPACLAVAAALGGGVVFYKVISRKKKTHARCLRETEFFLDRSAVLINNGSYGTVPRCIHVKQEELLREMERHPDRWFRHTVKGKMSEATRAAAKLFNVSEHCIGFVTNATTGVNAVLSSFPFKSGDKVLITNWAYVAVRNTAEHTCRRPDIELVTLSLQFPVHSEDEIVGQVEAALDSNPAVRLCIVEHITSPTAVVMPVERLTKVCRSRGVRILVDGAHAPGQLHVDLAKIDPDYYTGNFHKWFFAPRGCAFLYTRSDWHDEMQPTVISWDWKKTYTERFAMQGTRDETPFVVLPECFKFVDRVLGGQDAMMRHNRGLAKQAAAMLVERWGTEELAVPEEMCAPFMRLIRMPLDDLVTCTHERSHDDLNDKISFTYNVQVAPCFVQGVPYARISAQVYNDISDYQRLADCVLQFRESLLAQNS